MKMLHSEIFLVLMHNENPQLNIRNNLSTIKHSKQVKAEIKTLIVL